MLREAKLYISGELPIFVTSEYIQIILGKFLTIWPEERALTYEERDFLVTQI